MIIWHPVSPSETSQSQSAASSDCGKWRCWLAWLCENCQMTTSYTLNKKAITRSHDPIHKSYTTPPPRRRRNSEFFFRTQSIDLQTRRRIISPDEFIKKWSFRLKLDRPAGRRWQRDISFGGLTSQEAAVHTVDSSRNLIGGMYGENVPTRGDLLCVENNNAEVAANR